LCSSWVSANNLLEAVISVNVEKLYNYQFTSIILQVVDKRSVKKITVTKTELDTQFKEIIYQIGQKKHRIPILSNREIKNFGSSNSRIGSRFIRETFEIKNEIKKIFNLSFLSVSREKIINEILVERNQNEIYNAIDNRLEQLISDLTTYQLQLETDANKLSKKFQEDVLRNMLYNEDFDFIDISRPFEININEISTGLTKAYDVLGILDENTISIIESHTSAIKKSVDKINSSIIPSEEKVSIYANDVTPLTLFRRTKKIIDLSTELDKNKKSIFEKLDNYINLLNDFHETKYFTLGESNKGTINITKDNNPILPSELSSGEKQLLILLTETLLQRGKQTIFIADEPELSLHIEWQRKIISSIQELNSNSQIILATHSPEIVGKFKEKLINMEKIING
jgi:ABC-type dipeptide/oligopeptide/nickel transport system ATPase subunit